MYSSGGTGYTEDINVNPFFKILKRSKLYALVERNCWLVCVPQTSSLAGLKITQDILDVHVLQPSPYFQGEYITANNKTVAVEDGTISVTNDLREHRTAKVLFEETFYTKDNKSFRVLCIDTPLAGDIKKNASNELQLPSTRSLKAITNFLTANPINTIVLAKVHEQIEELSRTYVLVKGFEEHAVGKAKALSAKALEDLAIANPDIRNFYEDDRLTNELSLVVESYVVGALYPFFYPALKHNFIQEDNKIRDNLVIWRARNVAKELGLKPYLVQHIADITPHLQRMESCHTPLEKLWCVQEGIDAASFAVTLNRNGETLGADDTLPLLIAAVIEAAPPNLHTTLFYLQNFIFAKIASSALGYHLVNLQAAIQFVRGEEKESDAHTHAHASSPTRSMVATASRDPASPLPWQPVHAISDSHQNGDYHNRPNNRYSTSFVSEYRKSDEILEFLTQGISDTTNFAPNRHTPSVKSPRGDAKSPRPDESSNYGYATSYKLTDAHRASKSYNSIPTPLTSDNFQDWLGAPTPSKPSSSPPLGSRTHSDADLRPTPFSSASSSYNRNNPAFRSTPTFAHAPRNSGPVYKRAPEVIKVDAGLTTDEGEGGGFLAQLRKMGDDGVSSSQFRR
eukprot:Phypoly_transcript_03993.p1 GENE.Phypoly_transcript_03993~~Phypoly_transcript_03993.p1  ORF type:complete len:625 (+),score=138.54 Phypoly_transcript_03993:247-2121(+)